MAKTINISYNSEPSVFTYKPIDRGVIYGKRKRVPLDEKGNECVKAALLDDGSLLIRSGMTAQGYFTSSGSWVPNSELEAVNPDGSKPELFPATIGESVVAKQIDPGEALLMRFASTYSLEPEELSPALKSDLDKGLVVTFPFNVRADYHVETGILVGNENGYFALIGDPVSYEFCDLATQAPTAELDPAISEDDLDFEMF
jgi:hypothetical protein